MLQRIRYSEKINLFILRLYNSQLHYNECLQNRVEIHSKRWYSFSYGILFFEGDFT